MRRLAIISLVFVLLVGGGWMVLHTLMARNEAPFPAVLDPTSLRNLPAGSVVGMTGRYGSHVWLGIPYAQPPIGDLRWRAPLSAKPWSGTREALTLGNQCVQFPNALGGDRGEPGVVIGSEDCLYLNVYAPKMAPDAVPKEANRLPVLVWIHGGSNTFGSAGFYDGGALAEREKVIVVTTNYRLGPLGWFHHTSLGAGDATPAEQSGNYGTLDLVRALEWVRDNISGFGGDPNLVTVFGESAGGRNTVTLLVAPQAAGLFHRAIIQSGSTRPDSIAYAENWSDDPQPGHRHSSNEITAQLLITAGKAKDRESAKALMGAMPSDELAAFLRSRSAAELFKPYQVGGEETTIDLPQVFADGAVLPKDGTLQAFARKDGWNRMPVLVGTNRDEYKLFLIGSSRHIDRWLGFIPQAKDPDLYEATSQALSEEWRAVGAQAPATAMANVTPDVFVYRFDYDEWSSFIGFDFGKYLGAAHATEIPFVFGHWNLGPLTGIMFSSKNEGSRIDLSDAMRSYWVQFARTGNPGRGLEGKLPEWSAWTANTPEQKFMVFDSVAGGGIRMISDPVSLDSIANSILSDPRLNTQERRCWVLREVTTTPGGLNRADYDKFDCKEFPFEEFPWK